MTPVSPQQLAPVQQLLQQGRFEEAVRACRTLLKRHRGSAPVLQMLAVGLQRTGKPAEADQAYREALKGAPEAVPLLLDYGRFLRAAGRLSRAERQLRKAVKLAPQSDVAWQALGLLLRSSGQLGEAERCARRVVEIKPTSAGGWELLAAILQKSGNVEGAIQACRSGLGHIPRAPRLLYSLGQLLREATEFDAAGAAYLEALQAGFDTPDLFRNRAEALLDGGDSAEALACAQEGVRRHPGHALLQRTAARLHHEVAAPGDPLASLYAAARAAGSNPDLWQTLVELLKRLERGAEARDALAEARRLGSPDTPGLLILEAQQAALAGDNGGATRRFEALLKAVPDDVNVKINFAMHALGSGDPGHAAALCEAVLERDPFDQLALAYVGTAWQLLGDPREQWLLDYRTMVRPVPVPAPDEFADREAFFAALAAALDNLHRTGAHPIEQSVRGGTQTNGFLFRLREPLLQTLEQQIRRAIVTAMADFPADDRHPFWSRRHRRPSGDGLRFAGAWSVRLRGQGYHTNHIHPQGWVSSALYIALPDAVRHGDDTAGHIQFGAPLDELGLDLPPRRVVKPEVGTLVLFPSYMWHGTVPFESTQPRITVAFDLLPET